MIQCVLDLVSYLKPFRSAQKKKDMNVTVAQSLALTVDDDVDDVDDDAHFTDSPDRPTEFHFPLQETLPDFFFCLFFPLSLHNY